MAAERTRDLKRAQRWFHALADETRLQSIGRLAEGEQCVCDLAAALGVGQSRLSFHLKTLKDAGVVTDRRQGRWVYYALNPGTVEEMQGLVSSIRVPCGSLRAVSRACD